MTLFLQRENFERVEMLNRLYGVDYNRAISAEWALVEIQARPKKEIGKMGQFEQYQAEAARITREYLESIEVYTKSADFTPAAKQRAVAELRSRYDRQVAELRQKAASWVDSQDALLVSEQRKTRAAALAHEREVLGDFVMYQEYIEDVKRESTDALLEWASNPADEWEGLLLRRLVSRELKLRGDNGELSIGQRGMAQMALAELTNGEPLKQREFDLRRYREMLPELDMVGNSETAEQIYRVGAESYLATTLQSVEQATA